MDSSVNIVRVCTETGRITVRHQRINKIERELIIAIIVHKIFFSKKPDPTNVILIRNEYFLPHWESLKWMGQAVNFLILIMSWTTTVISWNRPLEEQPLGYYLISYRCYWLQIQTILIIVSTFLCVLQCWWLHHRVFVISQILVKIDDAPYLDVDSSWHLKAIWWPLRAPGNSTFLIRYSPLLFGTHKVDHAVTMVTATFARRRKNSQHFLVWWIVIHHRVITVFAHRAHTSYYSRQTRWITVQC